MRRLARALRRLLTDKGAGRARRAAEAMHQAWEDLAGAAPAEPRLACAAGCAHCCVQYVAIRAGEAFRLSAAIAARPPLERERLARSIAAADAATRGRSEDERLRTRTRCPLLDQNRCSLYEARPLACRAFVSLDVAACRRHFAGLATEIPAPNSHAARRIALLDAHDAALRQAGLPVRHYELNAALAIALSVPDAEERWLAGEDVLAPARGVTRVTATTAPPPTVR